MELIDNMLQRCSVRNYTGEKIPEEKLDKILQAGLLAPTSRDLRPCEFFLVRDRKILTSLASAKKAGAGMLAYAAAAIVVAADSDKADTWVEDSSIALAYMNLMAEDQEIGACWVQMHLRSSSDGKDAEDNVRRILSLPCGYRIVGILSLGIPAERRDPKNLKELDYGKVHLI